MFARRPSKLQTNENVVKLSDHPDESGRFSVVLIEPDGPERHECRDLAEKKYDCDKRSSSSTRVTDLRQHERTTRPASPDSGKEDSQPHNGSYTCESCAIEFVNLGTSNRHKCKLYKCDQCDSAFSRQPDLRRHERLLHSPIQKECRRCKSILPDKYNYILHIRNHKPKTARKAKREKS